MSGSRLARRLRSSDAAVAVAVGAVVFALYLATLQPDFGGPEDAPKFQFVGFVLGTAHPPGYPLYSLLSHVFVMLPLRTIAYRANLFSAVMAALACAIAFAIACQIGARRWSAAVAALALGTGASFWRNALFAEVYSLAAVMAALTILLLLAWSASGGAARLLAAVAAFGLGLGNHLTLVGLLPPAILFVAWRNRRALTPRVVAAAAAILMLCASQYGFVILRTWQRAPYLESSASSLPELWSVMTAQRFSGERFAFTPTALVTVQVPAVMSVVGRELGIIGALFLALGFVSAAWTRNSAALLVSGAALGMLAMVVNLSGDLKGFITPIVVLLWPIVALGADALRPGEKAGRAIGGGTALGVLAAAAMAMIPISNALINRAEVDRSDQTEDGRFFRSVFAQFPDRAAIVAEDYFFDMALHYYMFTGEGGPDRGITPIPFSPAAVRDAAKAGRRVFAFGRAASFLGSQGLSFERAPVSGPPVADWLRSLPRGTIVAGAAAYSTVPLELSTIDRRISGDVPRAHPFTVFALETRRSSKVSRQGDEGLSLHVDGQTFESKMPPLPGALVVAADSRGAQVALGGRRIADVDAGIALAVFRPDGSLWRTLEFPAGAPLRVEPETAAYQLKGDWPCVEIDADRWTDVAPVLFTGSALATLSAVGSLTIDGELPESCAAHARVSELLGAGTARLMSGAPNAEGTVTLSAELTRARYGRPLFRLALDCAPSTARARVRRGGAESTVMMCADRPPELFVAGAQRAALRPDFEAEAYFGGGWGDAERTPTGRVRRAGDRATFFLPLSPGFSYQLSLDLAASAPTRVDAALNGFVFDRCALARESAACSLALPPERIRAGVNALTLTVARSSSSEAPSLTFLGGRVSRRPASRRP